MVFDDFRKLAESTAGSYRLGMEAQGGDGMVALIDALPTLIRRNENIDGAVINKELSIMLDAQLRKDYLFLADYLHYRLPCLI